MDRTHDELTAPLGGEFRLAAEEFQPDVDASLATVRRSGQRRRRGRVAVGTAAALVVAVGGAAAAMSGTDSPAEVVAASEASQPPADTSVSAPITSDATLVMYRYPNLPPGAPTLRAVLHTPARTYYSGDLADETTPDQVRFGPAAAWEYGYGDVWTVIDHVDMSAPEQAIQAILDQQVDGPPGNPGPLDQSDPGDAAERLVYLISTGVGGPEQVKTLALLLETLPGVQWSSVDGLGVIQAGDTVLTYTPDTGRPVRQEWIGAPSATMEFVAVMGVDVSTVLDPIAAQNPNPVSLPTTTISGDRRAMEPSAQPDANMAITTTSIVGP